MTKRFIAIAIFITLLVAIVGCGSSQPAEPERVDTPLGTFEVYRNSQYGFSIQFPVDWRKTEPEGAAIKFIAPASESTTSLTPANANIIVLDLPQPMTLAEFTQQEEQELAAQIQQWQQLGEASFRIADTTLAGQPANEAFVMINQQQINANFHQIWTLKGQRAYILTFTSDIGRTADYAAIFDQMAASFKLGG